MTPQKHFKQQREINRVFLEHPIRSIWVRTLARMIEPRLPRSTPRKLPAALVALLVAELQIALIIHWLTGRSSVPPEVIASMLISNTQALLANP